MFRVLLAVAFFMVIFVYLTLMNPQPVTVVLSKGFSFTVPMAVLLVVSVAVGFVAAYVANLLKDIRLMALTSALKRQGRVKEKMTEAFLVKESFSSKAAQKFLEVSKVGKDPYMVSLYGRLLRENGDLEQAKELHSDLKMDQGEALFEAEFLRDLFEEGRFSEIVAIVKDIPKDKLSFSILKVAVDAALKIGEWSFASVMAERIFKLAPCETTEKFFLGVKTEELYSLRDVKGLRKLLKKRSDFVPAIDALVKLGDTAYVVEALRKAYRETKDPSFLFWLIDIVIKKEGADPKRTMDFISKTASQEDSRAALVKGYLYAEVGMYEEALKAVEEVKEGKSLCRYVRYKALKGLGRYEEGCQEADEVAKRGAFVYICGLCGYTSSHLSPKCPSCGGYDTLRLKVNGEV